MVLLCICLSIQWDVSQAPLTALSKNSRFGWHGDRPAVTEWLLTPSRGERSSILSYKLTPSFHLHWPSQKKRHLSAIRFCDIKCQFFVRRVGYSRKDAQWSPWPSWRWLAVCSARSSCCCHGSSQSSISSGGSAIVFGILAAVPPAQSERRGSVQLEKSNPTISFRAWGRR